MDRTPWVIQKQGGWKTFPYVIGGASGVVMASQGVSANLLVYLIKQFNIKNVDATQIVNVVNGCCQLAPVAGGIAADALGCYAVTSVSNAICVLSMLLFMLTAALPSLNPTTCFLGVCEVPTNARLALLYIAICLYIVSTGGNRYNSATLGANQLDNSDDRATFFNWFTVSMYVSLIIGTTGIVYIEDSVGWVFGFGLSAALCAVSVFVLHLGSPYYRHSENRENSFVTLLRSLVPTTWRTPKSDESLNYYDRLEDGSVTTLQALVPCESSMDQRSGEGKESLNIIIRLVPLMLSIIPLNIATGIKGSLVTLQAMAMDRHLGPNFLIPAASMPIFIMASSAFSILILDRIILPKWKLRPLQCIGISLFLTFLYLSGMAIIESRRLASLDSPNGVISVLWLALPMLLEGMTDALSFSAQLSFYYQEFPESLRSSSAGATALMGGIGCYLGTAAIALVRRVTNWLQDDTDQSRLDNVYWLLSVMVLLNFGYFLLCAVSYKGRGEAKICNPVTECSSGE